MTYRSAMAVEGETIGEAVAAAEGRLAAARVPSPDIDAQLLLAHVLGVSLPVLTLERGRRLTAGEAATYDMLVAGRAARRPLQHLIGEVGFYGRTFAVAPGVLIPRPETEQLVHVALALPGANGPGPVADVGSGTGVIGLTLAAERPGLRVLAIDSSPEARALTARNARRLGVAERVEILDGDLLAPVASGSLALVVANPPYVPTGDIPHLEPEVRDHDPRAALDGGPDGLRVMARLFAEAARVLRPGGQLAVEFGDGQADLVHEMAEREPFVALARHPDLSGRPRVLVAHRR
jgi:release factor glutamine methyltransferase